jgi:hypothetical protein
MLPYTKYPGARLIAVIVAGVGLMSPRAVDVALAQMPAEQGIEATSKAPPAFSVGMSDAEFARRYAVARLFIRPVQDLRQSTAPHQGVVLTHTGDVASEAGLKVNDMMTHLDGKPLGLFHGEISSVKRSVELTFYRPSTRETLKATVDQTHRLTTSITYDYALAYLRSDQANPAWDDLVVSAFEVSHIDPRLAQACMAKAMAAGLKPSLYTHIAGVLIASGLGRTDDALAYLDAIGAPAPGLGITFNGHQRMSFALAGGRLSDAYRQSGVLMQSHPEVIALRENLRALAERGKALGPVPALPSTREKEFNRPSVLGISPGMIGNYNHALGAGRDFAGVGYWTIGEAAGYYLLDFQPKAGLTNGEIRLRFRAQPAQAPSGDGFNPSVHLAAWDMRTTQELVSRRIGVQGRIMREEVVACIGVEAREGTSVAYFTLRTPTPSPIRVNIDAPQVRLDWSRAHELRLIVLDGWVQMILDGRTLSFTPLDPASRGAPVGLLIGIHDMKTEVLAYNAFEWTAKDSPMLAEWEKSRRPITDKGPIVHRAPRNQSTTKPATQPSNQ